MTRQNMIRFFDMFAGIGGICLGFKQAGFDIVWANENTPTGHTVPYII